MSRAPARASSTVLTLSPTKALASLNGSFTETEYILSASGSSPSSLAAVALVRLLGLYGRYRSSNSLDSTQFSIFERSSSVRAPAWLIVSRTVSLRFSISAKTSVQWRISATATSSRPPVRSFLYLLINGIVAPSSKRAAQFSTCHSFT